MDRQNGQLGPIVGNAGHPGNAANTVNTAYTIDLVELFFVYWHRLWLFILVGAICATSAYCYSRFVLAPTYESKASIYAMRQSNDAQLTNSDVYLTDELLVDYQEIIKSRIVLEKTVEKSGYEMTYKALEGVITLENEEDSHVIHVTLTTNDPVKSQRLCQTLCEVSVDYIKDITEAKYVNIIDKASYNDSKVGPKNFRNGLIGGLAGALVVMIILTIIYLTDDRIKKPDDIEKKLGWTVLGQIPFLDLAVNERV